MAHRIRKNRMGGHHHLHLLQDSIPDRLLSPELDLVKTRECPGPDSWDIVGDEFVLLQT